jgi:DNA polymerase alpha subunit B
MYQVSLSLERALLTFRNPDNAGLYDRLPNYILQQRHFYPLFPARSEARVAIQESGLAEFVGGTPDMLILPSELGYFAKVVELFCVVLMLGC